MSIQNYCLIIINDIQTHPVERLRHFTSQGLSKLNEILPSFTSLIEGFKSKLEQINDNDVQLNGTADDNSEDETGKQLYLRLLVQPNYQLLKKAFVETVVPEKEGESYVLYIGSYSSGYCADWMLEDGVLSARQLLHLMKSDLAADEWINKSNVDAPHHLNILTPSNSAHWNKVLSKLKVKDSKTDLVRVFSFESDLEDGTTAVKEEIQLLAVSIVARQQQHQQSRRNGAAPKRTTHSTGYLPMADKSGSLYVFDEGPGQSSLLAINGFNMLIDAGYRPQPELWKFVQKLNKVDALMCSSWNHTNLLGLHSLLESPDSLLDGSGDSGSPWQLPYALLPCPGSTSLPVQRSQSRDLELSPLQLVADITAALQHQQTLTETAHRSGASPRQLYHKLGHGRLELLPLWPAAPEQCGEARRYFEEWTVKPTPSIHMDELIRDHACASLLMWHKPAGAVWRVLVTGSCHETALLKALDEAAKTSGHCTNPSGRAPVSSKPASRTTTATKSKTVSEPAAKKSMVSKDKPKEVVAEKPPSKATATSLKEKTKTTKFTTMKEKPNEVAALKPKEATIISTKDKPRETAKPKAAAATTKSSAAPSKPKVTKEPVAKKEVISKTATSAARKEVTKSADVKKAPDLSKKSTRDVKSADMTKKPAPTATKKAPVDSKKTTALTKIKPKEKVDVKKEQKVPSSEAEKRPSIVEDIVGVTAVDEVVNAQNLLQQQQPRSVSLNTTDDTLNNIDTSEQLGNVEHIPIVLPEQVNEVAPESDHRIEWQSAPLSDFVTENSEQPRTEEDVEPLKTDGAFSLEHNTNESQFQKMQNELEELEAVGVNVNQEMGELEDTNADSLEDLEHHVHEKETNIHEKEEEAIEIEQHEEDMISEKNEERSSENINEISEEPSDNHLDDDSNIQADDSNIQADQEVEKGVSKQCDYYEQPHQESDSEVVQDTTEDVHSELQSNMEADVEEDQLEYVEVDHSNYEEEIRHKEITASDRDLSEEVAAESELDSQQDDKESHMNGDHDEEKEICHEDKHFDEEEMRSEENKLETEDHDSEAIEGDLDDEEVYSKEYLMENKASEMPELKDEEDESNHDDDDDLQDDEENSMKEVRDEDEEIQDTIGEHSEYFDKEQLQFAPQIPEEVLSGTEEDEEYYDKEVHIAPEHPFEENAHDAELSDDKPVAMFETKDNTVEAEMHHDCYDKDGIKLLHLSPEQPLEREDTDQIHETPLDQVTEEPKEVRPIESETHDDYFEKEEVNSQFPSPDNFEGANHFENNVADYEKIDFKSENQVEVPLEDNKSVDNILNNHEKNVQYEIEDHSHECQTKDLQNKTDFVENEDDGSYNENDISANHIKNLYDQQLIEDKSFDDVLQYGDAERVDDFGLDDPGFEKTDNLVEAPVDDFQNDDSEIQEHRAASAVLIDEEIEASTDDIQHPEITSHNKDSQLLYTDENFEHEEANKEDQNIDENKDFGFEDFEKHGDVQDDYVEDLGDTKYLSQEVELVKNDVDRNILKNEEVDDKEFDDAKQPEIDLEETAEHTNELEMPIHFDRNLPEEYDKNIQDQDVSSTSAIYGSEDLLGSDSGHLKQNMSDPDHNIDADDETVDDAHHEFYGSLEPQIDEVPREISNFKEDFPTNTQLVKDESTEFTEIPQIIGMRQPDSFEELKHSPPFLSEDHKLAEPFHMEEHLEDPRPFTEVSPTIDVGFDKHEEAQEQIGEVVSLEAPKESDDGFDEQKQLEEDGPDFTTHENQTHSLIDIANDNVELVESLPNDDYDLSHKEQLQFAPQIPENDLDEEVLSGTEQDEEHYDKPVHQVPEQDDTVLENEFYQTSKEAEFQPDSTHEDETEVQKSPMFEDNVSLMKDSDEVESLPNDDYDLSHKEQLQFAPQIPENDQDEEVLSGTEQDEEHYDKPVHQVPEQDDTVLENEFYQTSKEAEFQPDSTHEDETEVQKSPMFEDNVSLMKDSDEVESLPNDDYDLSHKEQLQFAPQIPENDLDEEVLSGTEQDEEHYDKPVHQVPEQDDTVLENEFYQTSKEAEFQPDSTHEDETEVQKSPMFEDNVSLMKDSDEVESLPNDDYDLSHKEQLQFAPQIPENDLDEEVLSGTEQDEEHYDKPVHQVPEQDDTVLENEFYQTSKEAEFQPDSTHEDETEVQKSPMFEDNVSLMKNSDEVEQHGPDMPSPYDNFGADFGSLKLISPDTDNSTASEMSADIVKDYNEKHDNSLDDTIAVKSSNISVVKEEVDEDAEDEEKYDFGVHIAHNSKSAANFPDQFEEIKRSNEMQDISTFEQGQKPFHDTNFMDTFNEIKRSNELQDISAMEPTEHAFVDEPPSDRESSVESVVMQSGIPDAADVSISNKTPTCNETMLSDNHKTVPVNGDSYNETTFQQHESEPLHSWNEPMGLPLPTVTAKCTKSTAATNSAPSTTKSSSASGTATAKTKSALSSHPSSAKTATTSKSTVAPKTNGTAHNDVSTKTSASTASPRRTKPTAAVAATTRPGTCKVESSTASSLASTRPATASGKLAAKKSEVPVDYSKLPGHYVDVAFVPVDMDGSVNADRVGLSFFWRVRATHYVLPGLEHDVRVLDNFLAAVSEWRFNLPDDSKVELIPVKMSTVLEQWAVQNAEKLSRYSIQIAAAIEHRSLSLTDDDSGGTVSSALRIDF